MIFNEVLSSEAEIDSIIGRPNSRVLAKVTNRLDDLGREFIGASPFLVVSSSDSQGRMDCSPKGDPAGLVQVLDDWTLAIPERPGNRRADTFRNVLQNPKVGPYFSCPEKGKRSELMGRRG
jgi:predicted pyridoxine 5'-phosphate oxidase superfamily flavin-nucleotide-binding protein